MKKENQFTLFIFFFIIIILIIFSKLFGEANRLSIGPIEPLSWSEVQNHSLKYLFISIVLTIIARYFYIEAGKLKEKEIKDARKRIAEREKKEKESERDIHQELSENHDSKMNRKKNESSGST